MRRRLEVLEAEQRATAEREKLRQKELHWMHCPKCGDHLATENYLAVEIDLCPNCRGMWLDAHELEAILVNDSSFLQSCRKLLQSR